MFYRKDIISREDLEKTLLTCEKLEVVYDMHGRVIGYIIIDTLSNPRKDDIQCVQYQRCCMNCRNNDPDKNYCNKHEHEVRDDTVCKFWNPSGPERNKKVMRRNFDFRKWRESNK